jgi:CxxC motif-containing protein (DUF1111 family)
MRFFIVIFCVVATLADAQLSRRNHPPPPQPSPTPSLSGFGALIQGTTTAEGQAWVVGRTQFETVLGPADGLGPIFNGQSCVQCHTQPDINGAPIPGGASAVTETRFVTTSHVFDLLHQAALDPSVQDGVPIDAVLVAHRKTTPLFGMGLIEAIPDATIIANVHVHPIDGVIGQAAMLNDAVTNFIASTTGPNNHVGRFGWKCQQASLLAFSADAYINEIGVTNRFFSTDIAPYALGVEPPNQALLAAAEPAGITPTTLQDTPADPTQPESPTNKDDIDRFTDFMQLNAPPPTVPLTNQAKFGQTVFKMTNCVACHTPSMTTGANSIAALSFQPVPLYSDLLLHDMGTLGDGIVQAAAGATFMRTAPLWGLRARSPFLHDGRASNIQEAIQLHDGEAKTIRDRYMLLPQASKDALIAFLNSI